MFTQHKRNGMLVLFEPSPPFPKFATLETNTLATYSSQIVPMILEFCNGLDFRTCFLFTRCFRCCDHHGGFDTGI